LSRRILHIIDTLDRGGTARQLCLLARGLPHEEFENYVCSLSLEHGAWSMEAERHSPFSFLLSPCSKLLRPVHSIGRRWYGDPQTFWRLLRHVREVRPDCIVSWQAAGRAYAAAAARSAGVPRVVAVWREIEPPLWPLQGSIDRYVGRQASAVLAMDAAVRDYCIAQGIDAEKIQVIAGGTGKPASPVVTRRQILQRLGLPESARLIGWAGRLLANRGGKDAIWAADLLKVIRDDAHLLIFGTGPHRDRLYRFREQVEIADKVHFFGDRGDLDEIMPHLDQFWSTRQLPGLSQAVLEAMAAGVPVVATDLAGTRDVIEHEVTGYLVAPGHRAGFARWAEHLLNCPDAARRIGTAGRDRVEKEFSAEKMIESWRYLLLPGRGGQ
jgi:glycosyltransferase involved in cell wall biosynthesis